MESAVVAAVFATVGYVTIFKFKLFFLNISLSYKHLNM